MKNSSWRKVRAEMIRRGLVNEEKVAEHRAEAEAKLKAERDKETEK